MILEPWLPNGDIEYLGRKDNQVKINGYRVELGEMEQAINHAESPSDVAPEVFGDEVMREEQPS